MTKGTERNWIATIFFIVLTGIVLVMRFGSRIWFRQSPRGPDWLCLLSAVLLYVQSALIIMFIKKHGAYSIGPPLTAEGSAELLKMTWIEEFLFSGILTSVKLSILWFYYIIFYIDRTFRRMIIVTTSICILWFVVVLFLIIFQCNPMDAFWTKQFFSQYCIDITKLLLGYELTNFFIDVLILCIPIGAVRKLNLPLLKKIAVTGIFLLGGLVCVASIVRIAAIWRLPNPSADFDFDTLILVGIIQSGLAITAACLPTLGPITSAAFRACTQPREGHRGTRKLRLPTSNIMHQAGYRLYSLGFPALSRASTHRQGLVHDCVSGSSHEGGDVSMPSSRSFNQSPENHDEEIGRETWAG